MQPRTVILTALLGGTLMGSCLGLATDPVMVPPPEPHWRKLPVVTISPEPRRYVDLGPQDLSPTWYLDRMPTWKRRALEREAAAYAEWQELTYDTVSEAPPPQPEDRSEGRNLAAQGEAAMVDSPLGNARIAVGPVRAAVVKAAAREELTVAPPVKIVRIDAVPREISGN